MSISTTIVRSLGKQADQPDPDNRLIRHTPRRGGDPAALIRPDTAERIWCETPGHAWDLILASELMQILDPTASRLCANDWEYMERTGRPPFEPQWIWKSGPGQPRVIRKDRAIAWACNDGQPLPASDCWGLSAEELGRMGFSGMWCLERVEEQILWLLEKRIITLRFERRRSAGPYLPFGEDHPGRTGGDPWGRIGDLPDGWRARRYFSIPRDDK
jgi:hypothetical protein